VTEPSRTLRTAGTRAPSVLARYQPKLFRHSSHDQVLGILARYARAGQSVLDVGTGGGVLGAQLAGRGLHCIGVEIDAEAAAAARPFYEAMHVIDLSREGLPGAHTFDWIVLADVLEHIPDPGSLLERCRMALRPGGRVIVSVPNVAHAWVRLCVLFGRFPYADRGILDRTHLRYFTWRTLGDLLAEHGFRVLERHVTPVPLELVATVFGRSGFAWLRAINHATARAWKSLLAYQNVALASVS
jgi:2-polyprenyl-3-methyl-5-hydroxy-6-metoxy-1,4-benzoquinol methylase